MNFYSIIKFIWSISWCPITFTQGSGSTSSSNEYNKYSDGTNIWAIIVVGNAAQTNSNDVECLNLCR